MERDLDSLKGYVQLVAGALTPAPQLLVSHADRPAEAAGTEVEGATSAPTTAAARNGQVGFLDRLACPVCRSEVRVVPEIFTADGRVKRGHVPCATCGEVVALVRDFRVDFRARGGVPPTHVEPARMIPALGEMRMRFDDPRLRASGNWSYWDGRFVNLHSLTESLEYTGKFSDALVHLVTHVSGGIVDCFVDGRLTVTADLYSEHWFVLPFTIASDLPFEEHVLRIQPRGTRNPAATSADVLVAELVLHGPGTDLGFEEPQPMNRGNPYMEVFERSISQVPEGDLILEVGGGERRRLRRGYINLEYMSMECADVYGDIDRLPFQDDTFSLVLAQAVFEHLANPFTAAAELIRVTKPGGLIVADVAFIQPLHAAPYHYFNMTQRGFEELFRSCAIVESDHYDGFAFTIEWILRSVRAHEKVTATEFADLIESIRTIDSRLSHTDVRPAASGVWVVVRKPGGASRTVSEISLTEQPAPVEQLAMEHESPT